MWVKKAGGTVEDENFYSTCVRRLLTAESRQSYNELQAECADRWSPAFTSYFRDSVEAGILASAEFAIRDLDIASLPYVGVTNNVSESFNRVLKDFQNWKVITVDSFNKLYNVMTRKNSCVYPYHLAIFIASKKRPIGKGCQSLSGLWLIFLNHSMHSSV